MYLSISVHLFVYYLFSFPELLGKSCLAQHVFRKKRWEVRRTYPPGETLAHGNWWPTGLLDCSIHQTLPQEFPLDYGRGRSWWTVGMIHLYLDCYETKGKCTWVKQGEEGVCLETVDIQSDSLRGVCGQRESGRWLERCELARQTDLDLNSGAIVCLPLC